MSELSNPGGGGGGHPTDEEQVRRLLREAGARPEVPREDLEAIKEAFRGEWRAHQGRRLARTGKESAPAPQRLGPQSFEPQGLGPRRDVPPPSPSLRRSPPAHRSQRGRWRRLALAAAVLLAVGTVLWWWILTPSATSGSAAQVLRVAGVALHHPPDDAAGAPAAPLGPGQALAVGTMVEVAEQPPGTVALQLGGGSSVRLDAGSRVRLASASVLELDRGAVYIDSGPEPRRAAAVAVRTRLGSVTDVGTQFEVRLLEAGLEGGGGALRVRVREGEVRIEQGGAVHSALGGAEVTLDAAGTVTRRPLERYGAPWRWVLEAAPRFAIEGRSLGELLDWVGRETGWEIRYADGELEAAAGSILLHGTLGDLVPDQAPAAVLPGAGLRHELRNGVLVVHRAAGSVQY